MNKVFSECSGLTQTKYSSRLAPCCMKMFVKLNKRNNSNTVFPSELSFLSALRTLEMNNFKFEQLVLITKFDDGSQSKSYWQATTPPFPFPPPPPPPPPPSNNSFKMLRPRSDVLHMMHQHQLHDNVIIPSLST